MPDWLLFSSPGKAEEGLKHLESKEIEILLPRSSQTDVELRAVPRDWPEARPRCSQRHVASCDDVRTKMQRPGPCRAVRSSWGTGVMCSGGQSTLTLALLHLDGIWYCR